MNNDLIQAANHSVYIATAMLRSITKKRESCEEGKVRDSNNIVDLMNRGYLRKSANSLLGMVQLLKAGS